MLLSSHYPPTHCQEGKKALASGWKPYKKKCKRLFNWNKYKNLIISFFNSGLAKSNSDLSRVVEVLVKEFLKDTLASFYKQ